MTTINNQTALDAWNKMTTAQQQNYWTSATDENKNVLSAAWIKFTPPATWAAWVPVYQPEAKWIDPQGREVAESAYQAHIKAGNDVSAWKPISGPGSAAESVATTMTPSEATSVPWETAPAAIDVIQENADVQFAKNKELQANLEQAKLKLDAQFATIQDKFTEAQQASLSRINEMEANWMENYNKMNQLNEEFYITQNKALDERVGWQQAGIAAELSGKGIASGVIWNVVWQAQEAALSQYAALKESNINSLRTLNQEYLNFFKDVEATKKTWSDEEIALIKEKFAYAKELIDAGKAINQESITATYAPQEAMVSAKVEWVTDVLKYQAQDETKINRYAESDAAERKVMLLWMLGLTSNDIMAWQSSRFDIALLDKAVQAKDLWTAIQRLAQASQAAASSTSSTAGSSRIVPAVNKSSGTSTSTETSTNTTPTNAVTKPEIVTPKYDIKKSTDWKYYYIANGKRYSSTSLSAIQKHITEAGWEWNILDSNALVWTWANAWLYQQAPIINWITLWASTNPIETQFKSWTKDAAIELLVRAKDLQSQIAAATDANQKKKLQQNLWLITWELRKYNTVILANAARSI